MSIRDPLFSEQAEVSKARPMWQRPIVVVLIIAVLAAVLAALTARPRDVDRAPQEVLVPFEVECEASDAGVESE